MPQFFVKFYLQLLRYVIQYLVNMGGVIKVVQEVLADGFVADGITQTQLKSKLRKLMQNHAQDFQLLNQISQFSDSIQGGQDKLVSRLLTNAMLVKKGWETTFDNLEKKTDLLKNLVTNFGDVRTSNFNHSYRSGVVFGASVSASACRAYSFLNGSGQISIPSRYSNLKKFFQETTATIRNSQHHPQAATFSQKRLIQAQPLQFTPNPSPFSTLSFSTYQSKLHPNLNLNPNPNPNSTSPLPQLLQIATNLHKFLNGAIGLTDLKTRLKSHENLCKKNTKIEEEMLDVLGSVLVDVFNLGNLGRFGVEQMRNMLLVKSVVLARNNQRVLACGRWLDLEKIGLNQKFFGELGNLLKACNQILSQKKTPTQKLRSISTHLQDFFDSQNPTRVFLNAASSLSKATKEYSKISKQVDKEQRKIDSFLDRISIIFLKKRGKNFNSRPLSEKQQVDGEILRKAIQKYGINFHSNASLQNLSQADKDIIFQAVTSFTNEFYADDESGKRLFGKSIEPTKSKISYKQFLGTLQQGTSIIVPVCSQSHKNEDEEWLKLARQTNKSHGFANWKQEDCLEPVYKYIRIKAENRGARGARVLTSYEGIRVKVNQEFFEIEKKLTV